MEICFGVVLCTSVAQCSIRGQHAGQTAMDTSLLVVLLIVREWILKTNIIFIRFTLMHSYQIIL